MFFGETGCGKTTLINSFANYLLGVNIIDDYRYKIIQKNINNQDNIYNIRSIEPPPPIKIINTPGFNANEGIEEENNKFKTIQKLFNENINEINAICFILKSTSIKLTYYQNYVYGRLLDIFGENLKENIIFLLTFCDSGLPNILEPLKSNESPFKELIETRTGLGWYYKFNNCSFYESNREDEKNKLFWKLGIKNFEELLSKLKVLPKINLSLTKEVLRDRELLEGKVNILKSKQKNVINKVEEIKTLIERISKLKKQVNDSRGYEYKIKVPKLIKYSEDPNFKSITCVKCNLTCHAHCNIFDNEEVKKCHIMDSNGYCKMCPQKCEWNYHKCLDYILEMRMEEEIQTIEHLKSFHLDAKNNLAKVKQLFIEEKDKLNNLFSDCVQNQQLIYIDSQRLQTKSLKKTFKSEEEYFKKSIEAEKSEPKSGWENRIKMLESLKENKNLLSEIYNNTNSKMNQARDFINNELSNIRENEI